MNNNPVINAIAAAVYIVLIVFIVEGIVDGTEESLVVPMVMLSLLVLSVLVMGYLFISRPLELYLEGRRPEALGFFIRTVSIFAICAAIFLVILLIV